MDSVEQMAGYLDCHIKTSLVYCEGISLKALNLLTYTAFLCTVSEEGGK